MSGHTSETLGHLVIQMLGGVGCTFLDLVMKADLTDRSCQVVVPCCSHMGPCWGLLHGWMIWGEE